MGSLSLRDLNRATLHRQLLIERRTAAVADVVGLVTGLQAQHASWPYVALWSRRHTGGVSELEAALADRSVVKATAMRSTLHLLDATHARTVDRMTAPARLANWRPSATRAGLDLHELNAQVRAFCAQPRTVAEIEAHLREDHPGVEPAEHIPAGVRNAWFRLATAGGGLVHAPPSGFFAEHGKPAYVDIDVWLDHPGQGAPATPADALRTGIERFLAAYGPATAADLMQWSGRRRIGDVRTALTGLGDRIVEHTGPDAQTYLDLADLQLPPADTPAPPRFLARWDGALIAYAPAGRARLVAPEHTPAVYRRNGDVLPTFLVDGTVAGRWSIETTTGRATLLVEPFGRIRPADRPALVDEAEHLVRHLAPDAEAHEVTWADTA